MGIAFVQGKKNQSGWANSLAATFDSTPGAGTLIVVFAAGSNTATLSCADNKGNTYASAVGGGASAIFYAYNVTSSATFTVTVSASAYGSMDIYLMEWSGFGTSDPKDQTGSGTGSWGTGPWTVTLSSATTQNDELIVALADAMATARTWTYDNANYTERLNEGSSSYCPSHGVSRIVTSTSAYAHQWSSNVSTAPQLLIASFKGATAAGATIIGPFPVFRPDILTG
jgi:hypothetical protein